MSQKWYLFSKRVFDFLAAVLGLVASFPFWIIAIIGIELSDPGPIFYKAIRLGKSNQAFTMLKFRSMRVARAEHEKSEASFKADSSRIFPFGQLLRRLKIDELPQLLNILDGSMSVVGPRPVAKDQAEIMRAGKYNAASAVKPGLTGPAALFDYIYGDSVEDPEDYNRLVLPMRLELEAYYPNRMSAGYDIKMIWYTIVCVVCTLFRKRPNRIYNELTTCVTVSEHFAPQEVAL